MKSLIRKGGQRKKKTVPSMDHVQHHTHRTKLSSERSCHMSLLTSLFSYTTGSSTGCTCPCKANLMRSAHSSSGIEYEHIAMRTDRGGGDPVGLAHSCHRLCSSLFSFIVYISYLMACCPADWNRYSWSTFTCFYYTRTNDNQFECYQTNRNGQRS